MENLVLRKAVPADMESIKSLQLDTFFGEQCIPKKDVVAPFDRSDVQWWCAVSQDQLLGAVAAWPESGQYHWGRFAVSPKSRGRHIGTGLAKFSLEDLFSQGVSEIHMEARETTVKIICNLGGKVVGPAVEFYKGTVTPVVVKREDYNALADI